MISTTITATNKPFSWGTTIADCVVRTSWVCLLWTTLFFWGTAISAAIRLTISKLYYEPLAVLLVQAITRPVVVFDLLPHMSDKFLSMVRGHYWKSIPGQLLHFHKVECLCIGLNMAFHLGPSQLNWVEFAVGHRKPYYLMFSNNNWALRLCHYFQVTTTVTHLQLLSCQPQNT